MQGPEVIGRGYMGIILRYIMGFSRDIYIYIYINMGHTVILEKESGHNKLETGYT